MNPRVVGNEFEAEELLLLRTPVGADALEHGGAVVEAMGHDVDVRVAQRHEFATEERPELGGRLHLRRLGSALLLQHIASSPVRHSAAVARGVSASCSSARSIPALGLSDACSAPPCCGISGLRFRPPLTA